MTQRSVRQSPLQMKRTPFHYAMAISPNLAEILQDHGADPDLLDVVRTEPLLNLLNVMQCTCR